MSLRWVVCGACLCLAGVGCGSGEIELRPDESQAAAFEKLRTAGAEVELDADGKIIAVNFENPGETDGALAVLKEVSTLKRVSLSGSSVTDAGLAHLEGISTLEIINLEDTQVSGAAVMKLKQALPNSQISYGAGEVEDDAEE